MRPVQPLAFLLAAPVVPALNYFIYPYSELDGKPLSGLQTQFSFKAIPPGGATDAK
jgi:hypothetical protein